MKEHDLDARALEIGSLIRGRLEKLAAEHAVIADVRGRGAMHGHRAVHPGTKEPDAAGPPPRRPHCHQSGVVP